MLTQSQKGHLKETVNELVTDIIAKYRKPSPEDRKSPETALELAQKALAALKKINQHFGEPDVYPLTVDSLPQFDPERQLIELHQNPLKSPLLPPEWLEGLTAAQQRELAGAITDGIELMFGTRLEVQEESVQALEKSASVSSPVQPANVAVKNVDAVKAASPVASVSSLRVSSAPDREQASSPSAGKASTLSIPLAKSAPTSPRKADKLYPEEIERDLLSKLEEFASLEFIASLEKPDPEIMTTLFKAITNGMNEISAPGNNEHEQFVKIVNQIIGGADKNAPLGARVGFVIGTPGGASGLHAKILSAVAAEAQAVQERVYRQRAGAWAPVVSVAISPNTTASTSSSSTSPRTAATSSTSTSPRVADVVFNFSPDEKKLLADLQALEKNQNPANTSGLVKGILDQMKAMAMSGQHGQFLKMIGDINGGAKDADLRRRISQMLDDGRAGELYKKIMDYKKMLDKASASSEERSKPVKSPRFGEIPSPPPGYLDLAASAASVSSTSSSATASTSVRSSEEQALLRRAVGIDDLSKILASGAVPESGVVSTNALATASTSSGERPAKLVSSVERSALLDPKKAESSGGEILSTFASIFPRPSATSVMLRNAKLPGAAAPSTSPSAASPRPSSDDSDSEEQGALPPSPGQSQGQGRK